MRARNDPGQYDDLAGEWWDPYGKFAALHWLAEVRGAAVPEGPGTLLDVACGAGLLAPHVPEGWRHVGIDLSQLSLQQARGHGVTPARADALRLPFADGTFDCVVAGEVLEHVPDLDQACHEITRVLKESGSLVIDTIANTGFARVALVHVAERLPGGPPPRIHDPELFVDRARLREALARGGVRVERLIGLRPSLVDYAAWLRRRRPQVRMVPTRSTAGVYQALGTKETR